MKASLTLKSLIIFFLLFQDTPVSSIADIKLPARAERLSLVKLKKITDSNLKSSNGFQKIKHIYQIDGTVIAFEDIIVKKSEAKSLQEIRDGILSEGEEFLVSGKKMTIETINKNQFLITRRIINDEFLLTFSSDTKNYKKIRGAVTFKVKEQKAGEKIFYELLNNIVFKK